VKRFISLCSVAVVVTTLTVAAQAPNLVRQVRDAIAAGDFAKGEQLVAADRTANGVTPMMLEALSWLGRGALAAGRLDQADGYARETHTLSLEALRSRRMDDEPRLPIAIGAAIEVQAQVAAGRGERSLGVQFLQQELAKYADTSLYKRIQKNINLLSLTGEVAPALDRSEYLGPSGAALADLKGKVVVLFFWAHWCPDCKRQGPVLADLLRQYGPQGLAVVAPTQRFGYVAGGKPAAPADEARYIAEVRATQYSFLDGRDVPLSEANHKRYGVSTTPTVVLVDRSGRIALYHPGDMSKDELEPLVRKLLATPAPTAH
jgi:thiol-disulfide isomerase/thioredoxin